MKPAATASKTQEMDDEVFQQLFDSLTQFGGEPAPVMSPDWMQQSVHSSPEIATPHDPFMTSPSAQSKPLGDGAPDLDVSALLNSPLFDVVPTVAPAAPSSSSSSPAPPPSTPAVSVPQLQHCQPIAPFDDLFLDLSSFVGTVSTPAPAQQSPPPPPSAPAPAATTPTFSARKRARPSDQGRPSPQDEAAIKRQKNTDAARRSRLRKVLKMEALERRVAELEKMNTALLLRAAVLESEKASLVSKEASFERRIKDLESQLAEAHRSLAGVSYTH